MASKFLVRQQLKSCSHAAAAANVTTLFFNGGGGKEGASKTRSINLQVHGLSY